MKENITCPFFSICIPLYNREKTIFATLSSLSKQTFKNFEVKIVVYNCIDNTSEEVKRFFLSDIFKNADFIYEIKYSNKEYDDWNGPVELANGKYIAMLEGDDQFLPNHLYKAHKYLLNNINIGIYATGNQHRKREKFGIIKSAEFFRYIYSMVAVPPPSETIFIRQNIKSENYLYDHTSFLYAPEIDLYLRIVRDGYDAYYDCAQDVWRYPSSYKLSSWKYYNDPFVILNKYKHNENITDNLYENTKYVITCIAVENYLKEYIKNASSTKNIKINLIKELGLITLIQYIILIAIKISLRLLLKKCKIEDLFLKTLKK